MTNDELFQRLEAWSKRKNVYSIRTFAEENGTSPKAIRELSHKNEEWSHTLSIAQMRCAVNAEKVLMSSKESNDEMVKSLYENDPFLREQLRGAGVDIPEDEDEFDEWATRKIADDNRIEDEAKRRSKQFSKLKK